jgi:DNA (cytosine-5)-methyltransferase 1
VRRKWEGELNVLDLFSGIGGFSLGLERAGMRTVAFCEIEPYCRAVLKKHWPHVPQYDDVRTLTAEKLAADGIRPDVICGGFPCQDISVAGKGAGITGERSGLWKEYARLIGEIRPRYVIVENVAALLGRGMGVVLGDLAEIGYDAEWHCISSAYVGCNHFRDRSWIVAYSNHANRGRKFRWIGWKIESIKEQHLYTIENQSEPLRMVNAVPHRMDRIKSVANSVIPAIPEIIGRAIMQAEKEFTD